MNNSSSVIGNKTSRTEWLAVFFIFMSTMIQNYIIHVAIQNKKKSKISKLSEFSTFITIFVTNFYFCLKKVCFPKREDYVLVHN